MFAFNRVILTGRVVTPPQCSYRPDGSPVMRFPLALDEPNDRKGEAASDGATNPVWKEKPAKGGSKLPVSGDLIEVVAIGKLAEVKMDLQSGQHLLVVGQLHQRRWKTPEGRNRTLTEVVAMDLRTIGEMESGAWRSPAEVDL